MPVGYDILSLGKLSAQKRKGSESDATINPDFKKD